MTSSLVGSEMCIRDSRFSLTRPSSNQGCPALPRSRMCSMTRPASHKPVSYTHLTLPTICSV
eukprot:11269532-Prorocentrum_lima.AAC.1